MLEPSRPFPAMWRELILSRKHRSAWAHHSCLSAHALACAMSHRQLLQGLWVLRKAGLCVRYTVDIVSPTES